MILINNWGNDFLFALLGQKEQIEQFTNLASKHVQEWIEGGHDNKQNIPTLIHMSLPEKASHSTKRARAVRTLAKSMTTGGGKAMTAHQLERMIRKTGNGNHVERRITSQNKTATKSSNEILKPPHPKTAEYQASMSAVKEIYHSFATAGSHRVFPHNHNLRACNRHPVCNPQ